MRITEEEVKNVAHLARLNVTDEELKSLTEQLDRILSYVAKLEELDTKGIDPTSHAIAIQNAFREDEVKDSLAQDKALANGPSQNGEAFVVPRVL